jgi:protein-tyrosine phosphatase
VFKSILVVCVGNICRSPMAEALLQRRLHERNISVSSAGLGALVGHQADEIAQNLMREQGIDISGHRARQLDSDLLRAAELILVMEGWQQREIEKNFPPTRGKVFRIGHWGNFDIADPYRKPREAFETALTAVERGIDEWMKRL